jgi:Type I phosphodiesterase / nucleotide pyrophosphatase
MHRSLSNLRLAALALVLGSLVLFFSPAAVSALGVQEARVVLVSIDGVAASELEDEGLELPNLRGMIRSGVWARSSETVFPPTDHPAHTSMTTGVSPREHGVIGNRLWNRDTGEYFHITNKPRAQSIRVPTLFDAAKAKGLGTAAFFWPETRDDSSIDHSIPVVLGGDGSPDESAVDPAFLDELRSKGVLIDLFFQWYNDLALQTTADRILTRAAIYTLVTYKPQLLAIRLPATDRYQHQYGPDHYLSKAALTAADYDVGLIRRAIEDAGLKETTTLLVVSDHGFQKIDRSVNVYPLFHQAGLIEKNKVRLHTGFGSVLVELTSAFDPARDSSALDAALGLTAALDGISRVVRPEELHALGLPRYEEDPHMLGQYLILGDAHTRAVVDEESSSSRPVVLTSPLYGHDALPSEPSMYTPFVAVGRRVKTGARVGHVSNLDIAPTIAELLGLSMEGLQGRVLVEILK